MKGDFTRDTFRADQHYSRVRMQQGRVQLDADWNEQVDITTHRIDTETVDTIGSCGAPLDDRGSGIGRNFHLLTDLSRLPGEEQAYLKTKNIASVGPADFLISPGHFYVDGILIENEHALPYRSQPDLPGADTITARKTYLAFLDVWQRHLTALEAPEIREVALGGSDTTTRARTIWQVRLMEVPDGTNCLSDVPAWNELIRGSTGSLAARAQPDLTNTDPCIVPASAGFRGLQNQLYRVEIHAGGDLGAATFKWSRDNGSVVFAIEEFLDGQPTDPTDRVRMRSFGRDQDLALRIGDWVEVLDDTNELTFTPGPLVQIQDIDSDDLIITLSVNVNKLDKKYHPKLRRWDSKDALAVEIAASNDGFIALEEGVEVRFTAGSYHTGDYWLIPARTILGNPTLTKTGGIEWPVENDLPISQPAQGIEHHYCRLGILKSEETTVALGDCRPLFPAATKLIHLHYISGDGQEVMPDRTLPQPLRAGVSNGRWPVAGARVRFEVETGNGSLKAGGNSGQQLDVFTGADGVASCEWALSTDVNIPSQRVKATLLDVADKPIHLPLYFNANLSIASQVAYSTQCAGLENVTTVQEALDELCRRENEFLTLRYVSGDGQEDVPGSELPAELTVAVENILGEPQAGVTVTFEVVTGSRTTTTGSLNGSLSSVSVTTDANGEAKVRWTLGPESGLNLAQASLDTPQAGTPKVIFNARGIVVTTGGGLCTFTVGDGKISHGEFNGIRGFFEAFDLASARGGGTICVLRGTYRFRDLGVRETIILTGARNIIIEGNQLETTFEAEKFMPFHFDRCRNIQLRDLRIRARQPDGPDPSSPLNGLVRFSHCSDITLERCQFDAESDQGHVNLSCLFIEDAELAEPNRVAPSAVIRDCRFRTQQANSISGVALRHTSKAWLVGNVIEILADGGGLGIDLDMGCDGCMIAENQVFGIVPSPQENRIGALGGIHVGSDCDEVIVRDNLIENGSGFGIGLGSIDIFFGSLGGMRGLSIERNVIRNMALSGIGMHRFQFVFDNQPLQPMTDDILIRENRIESCAYGTSPIIPTTNLSTTGDVFTRSYRLGAGIALWTGEGIRLLDNQIRENGHFDPAGVLSAPHPVCAVLIPGHGRGLELSRNQISNNFSPKEIDPELDPTNDVISAGGILLVHPDIGSAQVEQAGLIISENEVSSRGGPLLTFTNQNGFPPGNPVIISGNHFFGSNNNIIIFVNGNCPIQCNNNTIVGELTAANSEAVVMLTGREVMFTNNHCSSFGAFPVDSVVQIKTVSRSTVDQSVVATGNYCVGQRQSAPHASLSLIGDARPTTRLVAVANVTSFGVRFNPQNTSVDVANVDGVFI
jgi:hypothetical protein